MWPTIPRAGLTQICKKIIGILLTRNKPRCFEEFSITSKGMVKRLQGLSLHPLSPAGLHCGAQGANTNQNLSAERERKHLGEGRDGPWREGSTLERQRDLLGEQGVQALCCE